MVRLKSYASLRHPHPIRLHGFPRTDSYPSHDPGLTPQLPHGTTRAPAEQQAFNPLNAELNPICHLLALLGGANIVVISRLRVKKKMDI